MNIFFPLDKNSMLYWEDYPTPLSGNDMDKIDFLSETGWNSFIGDYVDNAEIIPPKEINYLTLDTTTSYTVTPSLQETIYYTFNVLEKGIYNFSMIVESGDLGIFITSESGSPIGINGYLFSNIRNGNYSNHENVVHWLNPGIFIVEIYSQSQIGVGQLQVSQIMPTELTLNEEYEGNFLPRRAW